MRPTHAIPRLADLPLWRLLVAMHDAETVAGPDSTSVEAIRQAIEDRLHRLRNAVPRQEEAHAPTPH
jgi:hypothetical protein